MLISSVAVDFLPTAQPGFNSFQVLLLVAGLIITPAAFILRRAQAGSAMLQRIRKNLLISIAATIISLVALELVLAVMGVPSHYPSEIPSVQYESAPWWTCDESGCHYAAAHIHKVCDSALYTVWPCVVNQQGFNDRQDFVWVDELARACG